MKLSYLEGHDVIAKANEIFGFGGWSYEVTRLSHIGTEEYRSSAGREGWTTAYYATVKVTVGEAVYEDSGFGNDIGYGSMLDTHEMAVKEAVTDALKRALKNLGDQFGLCLYSKESRPREADEGKPAPRVVRPAESDDPGNFLITFGKVNKGKTLKEAGRHYAKWLLDEIAKTEAKMRAGQKLNPRDEILKSVCTDFLILNPLDESEGGGME